MFKAMDKSLWSGRVDNEEDAPALRWHQVIQEWNGQASLKGATALLGFACDEGVRRNHGREGAKQGPKAIREALSNLAYFADAQPFDIGDVSCEDTGLEASQRLLSQHVQKILDHDGKPIVLGGGHEVAWGSFMGLANHLKSSQGVPRIGIINIDAHFDLRKPDPHATSGTPFRQIAQWSDENQQSFNCFAIGISPCNNTRALFEYAKLHNVDWQVDVECIDSKLPNLEKRLESFMNKIDELYVTICMDVFPSHACPGVSAPSALGIEPRWVIMLIHRLKELCQSHQVNWRISDIAELNPQYDFDTRSAKLAARLVHELVE